MTRTIVFDKTIATWTNQLPNNNCLLDLLYELGVRVLQFKSNYYSYFITGYKETILFAINISINPKQCENISKQEREKVHNHQQNTVNLIFYSVKNQKNLIQIFIQPHILPLVVFVW